MASENRTAPDRLTIEQALAEAPYSLDFHQALRRLECARRDLPRLGEALRPSDEPVRLGQDPSLSFAPSAVSAYRAAAAGRPARLSVTFFGLFGPQGPLPLHMTEYVRERIRHAGDGA
ncbi:MAG TPA: type VI secretion system baseplate subunit TssG, partial [Polyangiaceae bacterium]|nr:type VI secretion system baseplate subunit TssG [Polyangiaceae bacterium]